MSNNLKYSRLKKYTEMCKKYSIPKSFYYIFHMKPDFFKTLVQSQRKPPTCHKSMTDFVT